MTTQPDETHIIRWIDGELSGDELAAMETYAANHPELLELRTTARGVSQALQAQEELPHADFFTSQVMRKVQRESEDAAPSSVESGWWERLGGWLAPAAFAMMAISFFLGTQMNSKRSQVVGPATGAEIYTADSRVEARLETGEGDVPTVIVLTGWTAGEDSMDLVESGRFTAPAVAVHAENVPSLEAVVSF